MRKTGIVAAAESNGLLQFAQTDFIHGKAIRQRESALPGSQPLDASDEGYLESDALHRLKRIAGLSHHDMAHRVRQALPLAVRDPPQHGLFAAGADLGFGFWDALGQGALTIPAVWAVVAVAVAVIGARPQVRLASWAGVLASFGLTMLGPSFKLPGWALGISPFYHVPHVVVDTRSWWGLLGVCAVAALLLSIGFAGFRRRDIP